MPRIPYKPRLSWLPIKPVRSRTGGGEYGVPVRRYWRLYVFGLIRIPFVALPRRSS